MAALEPMMLSSELRVAASRRSAKFCSNASRTLSKRDAHEP